MKYKSKVCGAITLFYPTPEQIDNLFDYLEVFPELLIVDNTPTKNISYIEKVSNNKRIHLLSSFDNIGLAKGLNVMCGSAYDFGYEYCCVLDQDSILDKTSFEAMLAFIENYDKKAVLFCPNVRYKHQDYKKEVDTSPFKIVKWAITSGSFFNLNVFRAIGGFDENYFIDRLELDYCLKAKVNGFDTVQVSDVNLYQDLGESVQFMGLKTFQHSPLRVYYQFRNRIYFYTKKNYFPKATSYFKLFILSKKQILKVIFLESNKKEKIMYIYRAIIDSFKGKYGKYSKY